MHLAFCAELYEEQIRERRYFLHEHPAGASSWNEAVIKRIMGRNDVETVNMDQCQLGGDDGKGNPLKKTTKFMSNGLEILDALRRR